ncbi:MAG: DNA polymerase III subunit beta [Flavobacteriales bacterium]|nr:MAG: DNA polymerase III subunit beta [Flavobacteriales bacterium]
MNFIATSSELLQHLLTVNGAIMSKPIIPILDNFLFDISENQLKIYSTDLETSMITTMPVTCKESIKVAVPSKMIIDILRSLPDQGVTFSVDPQTFGIEVVNNNGRYKMAGQDGVDFPAVPETPPEGSFTLPANILLRAISKTLFATGSDELRLNLAGLYVEIKNNSINFVATDANKLVRLTRKDFNVGIDDNILIPKKPLNLLKTALPNDETPVVVDYNKSSVYFSFGETRVLCRLVDEKYPDYAAVIPAENNNVITISRMALLSSINRISIFASKTTYQVRFKVIGNELTISAEDIEMANEAVERIACEYDGSDMEIGFNAKFFKEMLATIDGEQVQLRLSAPNRAGLLVPFENERDEDITMLIMPMMLNNY